MIDPQDNLFNDFEAVKRISIIPSMLEVICQLTGMGFAAVARVTEDRWLACSVRDEVGFGLKAGGELEIKTTICNEIRDSQCPVVIEHVDEDENFKNHHTPKMYGLQSYISFPIILKNGLFFGTLCAIDARPNKVRDPKILGTFAMFADLLSFHLQGFDLVDRSHVAALELKAKNKALAEVNNDLDNFVYRVSHDLKAPISNIQGLLGALTDTVAREEADKAEINQIVGLMNVSVDRFSETLKDLTTIVASQQQQEQTELTNICEVVEDVQLDISKLISESGATIEVICGIAPAIYYSRKNLKSILYNLLSNAIKYRSPNRTPAIQVVTEMSDGKVKLLVKDNGLGLPADKKDKVFGMFNRLHDHVEGTGIGLYLVKRILEQAQGSIEVESVLGEGTTFKVIF